MSEIQERIYGKDYADNIIDNLLQFNSDQTWTVTSGTGSGTLDIDNPFEGVSALKIENTAPTTDLRITNSEQDTTIVYSGNYNFSCYLLKDEADEFLELDVTIFKNAVELDTVSLTLGSETTEDDRNDVWTRFSAPTTYSFIKNDTITFVFTLKGKAGTVLPTTTIWVDGMMLNENRRESKIVPEYAKSINTPVNTGTGWAQYGDSQYTSGSPLSCPVGVATTIDIDGLGNTIKTQLPVGVSDLYDVTTSKILPVSEGDGFAFTISFKAESTNVSGYATIGVDIGGAIGLIFNRVITFPKGSNTEHDYTLTTQGYQLNTFVANGGIVKLTSGIGTVSLYDITLQIHRTYRAS